MPLYTIEPPRACRSFPEVRPACPGWGVATVIKSLRTSADREGVRTTSGGEVVARAHGRRCDHHGDHGASQSGRAHHRCPADPYVEDVGCGARSSLAQLDRSARVRSAEARSCAMWTCQPEEIVPRPPKPMPPQC